MGLLDATTMGLLMVDATTQRAQQNFHATGNAATDVT